MGGEQAAAVLHLVESEKRARDGQEWPLEEQQAFKRRITDRYDAEGAPSFASARLWDDGVIDPADTRRVVGLSLAAAMNGMKPPEASRYGVFRM